MRYLALVTMCVVLLAMYGPLAVAGDREEGGATAPAAQGDYEQLVKDVRDQLNLVMRELLKIERKYRDDPEVVEARENMEQAREAYQKILNEKIAADPEGKDLQAKREELSQKLLELKLQHQENQEKQGKQAKPEQAGGEQKK